MPHRISACGLVLFALNVYGQTAAGPGVSDLDLVQVTANRFAEAVQEVPSSIEVVSGEELRARGVNDLRTALSMLAGVTVAPGGDEGPAGAVPGLLGLREVDDFELLVDGTPAGGAFIPQFATLDLNDVERIEVQRGPAPVLYGTTAFAGTINVIHYAAGAAGAQADLAYGTYGSWEGGVSAPLVDKGPYRGSLGIDGARERYSDPRAGADRGHLLLRNAKEVSGGEVRLDLDATVQHQRPWSPRPLEGEGFDPETPIDFNQNPADGKIDTQRLQLTAAYDRNTALGSWGTTLSVTRTQMQLIQGFFNEDMDSASGPGNATGFSQTRHLTEVYFDTHLTHRFSEGVIGTFGASELYGQAHQGSQVFAYTVPASGFSESSGEGTRQGSANLTDYRSFAGAYGQTRWNLTSRLGLLAGLRLNRTDERRTNASGDATLVQEASTTRLSGSVGVNWRVWQDREGDLDDVVLYGSYGNTFQPPQIDFGPDDAGPLLRPETARSYEAGVKADGLDGRFSADLGLFWVDFKNQAVATLVDNTPGIDSAGQERFKGAELEVKFRVSERLAISANYSCNDARYLDFRTVIDGESVQLAGNQLVLTPHHLAGLGAVYGGGDGLQGSVVANYVGSRFLNMRNTITAGSYVTVDATLGYAFRGWTLSVNGYNLTNRRDGVLESELGEGQVYLFPARRVFVKISVPL